MKKHTLLIIFCFTVFCTQAYAQVQRTNLPTIYITTANGQPITDKVTWVQGEILIKSNDTTEQISKPLEIRGRGNSTWDLAKKPYRIRLNTKTNLLNLPAREKNWVLLANHADKTLIRNALASQISNILGLEFTPSARFVDLVLNGTYLGNYMVTDQMETGFMRVNVEKLDTLFVSQPEITGGYMLEIDGFASREPVWFTSSKSLKITVKYPDSEDINPVLLNYIKDYINQFESRLFSADFKDPVKGYRAWVDTTSLINWYIGSELTGNSDSFWSTYVYKRRSNDKLFFGPMWDYDIAFNNDRRLGDATQKLMRQHAHNPRTWIEQMWLDEWFRAAVWRRWQSLVANNLQANLISYIDQTVTLINTSQQQNFVKWNVLNKQIYQEQYLFSTYSQGVDYLKSYIASRISFLNTSLAYTEPAKPSEPFVADNFYYMIMNKKTNNAIDVTSNSVSANATLVMWQPSETDDAQLWEIRSIPNNLFRIINKNSGLAMAGNGISNNLIQVPVNDADNAQKWYITPVGTGNIYGIVNLKSGYSVNNAGGNFANGTNAIEYTNNITGSENQQWYFQKMNLLSTGMIEPGNGATQFGVYPNPARSHVSVRLNVTGHDNIVVSIYSMDGMLKHTIPASRVAPGPYIVTVPLSGFVPGVYLVCVTNSLGHKTVRKLIVEN